MADVPTKPTVTFNVVPSQTTSQQKWIIAVLAGVLFALISSNMMYGFTNKLFSGINVGPLYKTGGPTTTGLVIHTIVFILLIRLILM